MREAQTKVLMFGNNYCKNNTHTHTHEPAQIADSRGQRQKKQTQGQIS